jgi:hypothetical protein
LTEEQETIDPPDMDDLNTFGRVDKFIIPAASKADIKSVLDQIGINNLSMYQSIEAVAQNIRDIYLMHR